MLGRGRHLAIRLLLAFACAMLTAGALASSAGAAARPCADLRVASVVIKPTDPATSQLISGQPAEITAKITNQGTCAAGGFVVAFKLSLLSSAAASESIASLGAGESTTVEMAYDFPAAGEFLTALQVNPAREVSETNYLNDTALRAVTVVAASATLAIHQFAITPSPPDPTDAIVQGRPAIATITVQNTGNVAAGAFTVQWTPFALGVPLAQAVPAGLAPGESATVQLEFVYTLAEAVVSRAAVLEAGRLAPVASATLEKVVEAPLPNIRISNVATQAGLAGSPSTIEVTVENSGNAAAGPFIVEWEPGPSQPAEAQQVEGLAEGASTTLTFVNVFATAGTYSGLVIADSTHELEELFTTEKQATTVLEVLPASVDLTVTAVSISPAKPTAESPATITVTVKNLGNTSSGPFILAWTPSTGAGSSLQTLAQETASLNAGESREVAFSFTYPSAGLFRSVADVNPQRAVKETSYSNNTRALFVRVQP
jgi:subtilase family serine protease